jgi:N6-L-threonylcarbamoyladenine synthase
LVVILAIETSCDDTCAAVVDGEGRMLANVISRQHVHDRFGGVVPEIAARHHLQLANAVVDRALADAGITLDQVQAVAVTQGPGLIGALLVGLATAKGLACSRELPLVAVDHLQGHVAANFLELPDLPPFEPPFLCLITSGGHTLLAQVETKDGFTVLGTTLDDAAGEAFDKGARLLGLGYPGGLHLERLAREGDPGAFSFPVPGKGHRGAGHAFRDSLDFSFAGLKTALAQTVRSLGAEELEGRKADLAASYQEAIVEALVLRVEQALAATGLDRLAVGGGVAANGRLRERLAGLGVEVHIPPPQLCMDNAAMIGSAARFLPSLPYPSYLSLDAYASGEGSR